MATMNQLSPDLYAAVLRALGSTASRSRSVASTMASLADGLSAAQARCLPDAIAGVLPLLRTDPERLRFAAEIASRLGYFETARAVADLAIGNDDRRLLLIAASMCGNPAADASVRARVANATRGDPAGRIRLDPDTVPTTVKEQHLYLQCWPGARTDDVPFGLAPIVVLDAGLDARAVLRFALSLDRAGAVVRRLAPNSPVPFWFGTQTVLLCQARTRTRVLSRYPSFSEAQIITDDLPENDRQLGLLLRRVNAVLPGPQKLRLAEFPPPPPPPRSPPLSGPRMSSQQVSTKPGKRLS